MKMRILAMALADILKYCPCRVARASGLPVFNSLRMSQLSRKTHEIRLLLPTPSEVSEGTPRAARGKHQIAGQRHLHPCQQTGSNTAVGPAHQKYGGLHIRLDCFAGVAHFVTKIYYACSHIRRSICLALRRLDESNCCSEKEG